MGDKKRHVLTDRASGIQELRREPSWIGNRHHPKQLGKGLGEPPNSQMQGTLVKHLSLPALNTWPLLPPSTSFFWLLAYHLPRFTNYSHDPLPRLLGGLLSPDPRGCRDSACLPTTSPETPLFHSGVCPHEDRGKRHGFRLDTTSELWHFTLSPKMDTGVDGPV